MGDMPPVVYSGSLERIDFGEEGDVKGFCWVELERGDTRWEFIPLENVRPFVTLKIDTRKAPNPTDVVIQEINRHDLQDAIVRILITADPESDSALQAKAVEDAVMGQRANIIAAIHRQVERPERTRLGSNPEGLTSMELAGTLPGYARHDPRSNPGFARSSGRYLPAGGRILLMRWSVLAALMLMLLAACGGNLDAPDDLPQGYTLVEGDRVGLALPSDWTAMQPTVEDYRAMVERVSQNNLPMAARLQDLAAAIDDDTLRLAAFHEDGFTNLNIAAQGTLPLQSVADRAAANRSGLEAVGYRIMETGTTEINGKEAARTVASIQIATSSGDVLDWVLLQYTLVTGGQSYSISFGAPRTFYFEYQSEFERIASTFHTLD